MFSDATTMTVLTHPLQTLLIGMILARLVRDGFAATSRAGRAPTDSNGSAVRASDLQAA